MINFDPHAAKIVTEFVLARIISAAIGPVSDQCFFRFGPNSLKIIGSKFSLKNSLKTQNFG